LKIMRWLFALLSALLMSMPSVATAAGVPSAAACRHEAADGMRDCCPDHDATCRDAACMARCLAAAMANPAVPSIGHEWRAGSGRPPAALALTTWQTPPPTPPPNASALLDPR